MMCGLNRKLYVRVLLTILFLINTIVFEETKTPDFFYVNRIATTCYFIDALLIILWILNEVTSQRPTYPVPPPTRPKLVDVALLELGSASNTSIDICDIA